MSRRPAKTVDKDGRVLARELARVISHYRRLEGEGRTTDRAIADGLSERFDIRPRDDQEGPGA